MNSPDQSRLSGAGRSLVWLGVVAIASFVAMICALGWASGLTGGKQGTGRAIDFDSNSIALSISNDPPQLDSTRTQDTQSGFVLGHIMEGLLRADEHNQIVGGVADQWEIARLAPRFTSGPMRDGATASLLPRTTSCSPGGCSSTLQMVRPMPA